jgi:predicted GNAT family acetyltransferase
LSQEELFLNPVRQALRERHAQFAVEQGLAVRYAPGVIPFAAVAENNGAAMRDLSALLASQEAIYIMSNGEPLAEAPGMVCEGSLHGLQMVAPRGTLPSVSEKVTVSRLSFEDVPAMLGLIAVAFPGFFFRRTKELGEYYGVWVEGQLVAMAGQRMAFDRYCEISAVCTHPEHTGKGYAAALMTRLMHDHEAEGRQSFLHVAASNERARGIYRRLGFEPYREVEFQRMRRVE